MRGREAKGGRWEGDLGNEDVDTSDVVHDLLEALSLRLDVDSKLRNIDCVDVTLPSVKADAGDKGSRKELILVLPCCGSRQPAAVAAHNLV